MAITKILTINDCGQKFSGKHLRQAIDYIIDGKKTQNMRFVTGINCQPQIAFKQMEATKRKYAKTDKRQGYHIIISFEEEDVKPSLAFEIVGKFVKEYLGDGYEAIYAVHDNTAHTHGHIIFNSVNYLNGRKYRYEKGDWAKLMQPITNRLCEEYGLSTIEIELEGLNQNEHYKDFNEFRDGQFIWRDMIKRDVDACIMQADSFGEFLQMLIDKGYSIKQNKYLAIKPSGMQRFCRCKSLGVQYTEDAIKERIEIENITAYANRLIEDTEPIVPPNDEFLRRTKLTGIQKIYYAKVCRIRHLEKLPYSHIWQYRNEIRKMNEVHDQYLFLVKYDIHSLEGLITIQEQFVEKRKECQQERTKLYREKKRLESLFAIADQMIELQLAENSFQNGDVFFLAEHEQYETLFHDLENQGYTFSEIQKLRDFMQAKLNGNYEKRRAVQESLKLANRMVDEVKELMIAHANNREVITQTISMDRNEEQPKK